MGKRGRNQKKSSRNSARSDGGELQNMDDEIDAFYKQRDVVPLDLNKDAGESDEDDEFPVFDIEDGDDDNDEDDDDDPENNGLAAKIVRQKRYLRAKYGDINDEMDDNDNDEDGEDRMVTWGGLKHRYFGGDNADFELQSSDDESLAEEEEEVLRLQRKAAESLTAEDMGLEDDDSKDEGERELSLEELSAKGKRATQSLQLRGAKEDIDTTVIDVVKDLNSLSRDEQMDVVYSSAPELVGLLSELNDANEQLVNKINPLLSKFKGGEVKMKGGMRYLEVKQVLLLAYCQAITFYLLLKSEGQPVCDHPVIARLVEVKALLDKMKELDVNLPSNFEEILKKNIVAETVKAADKGNGSLVPDTLMKDQGSSYVSLEMVKNTQGAVEHNIIPSAEVDSLEKSKKKGGKRKHKDDDQVRLQSTEMLKVRAALEEKLKSKGAFDSINPNPEKSHKHLKSVNGQLEAFDDYGDLDAEAGALGVANKNSSMPMTHKLSQLIATRLKKPKIISGDDDLPKRDDIGERRRKYELQVLVSAGVKSEDDAGDELDESEPDREPDTVEANTDESEDDFYTQVKRQREAKLAAKAKMYTKESAIPSLPEIVEGKRHISYQMEKNRGLTRKRNKDLKNPRKKYRTKHQEKVKRRKGQVQSIRKPTGTYGGETTGINAGISRSVRFKN